MLIMSGSFTILIYPHQRLRHLRPAVDGLADAVTRLYGQDMSALCWSECREGTLARFEGGVCPEMAARIPSAKLDCAALLLYLQEGGGWGYQLCFRGSVEDTFTAGEPPRRSGMPPGWSGGTERSAPPPGWGCGAARDFASARSGTNSFWTSGS